MSKEKIKGIERKLKQLKKEEKLLKRKVQDRKQEYRKLHGLTQAKIIMKTDRNYLKLKKIQGEIMNLKGRLKILKNRAEKENKK